MNSPRFLRYLCAAIVLVLCFASCDRKESSFFDLIPTQSTMVVESNSPGNLIHSLEGKSYLEPFVACDASVARLKEVLTALDTLIDASSKLKDELSKSPSCLTWIPSDNDAKLLWISKLSSKSTASSLSEIIRSQFDDFNIFSVESFLCITDGTEVVEEVRHQSAALQKIDDSEDFQRLQKTLGAYVDAHLYYHDERGWVVLDVLPKEESLTFNGYAMAADTLSSLKPLKYQRPVKNSVVNILPFNTSLMIHYGMSDFNSYRLSFCTSENFVEINKKYSVDVEKQFLDNIAESSLSIVGENHRPLFVARMTDPSAVTKFMGRISAKKEIASLTCQGYIINDLGNNDLIKTVFGDAFSPLSHLCYAVVDQYLVVANETKTIQDLISCYRSGRTLDLSENFKVYQKNMLESSNVTIFSIGTGNQPIISQFVGGKLGAYLNEHPRLLDGYSFVSLQLASSKDLVYVNMCFSQAVETVQENNILWKVNMDSPLMMTPTIIRTSQMSYVVAFDQNKSIYLIDGNGELLWKNSFDESPMGPVVPVRTETGMALLFNTAHTIQGLDLRGEDVQNFPISLPFEASNGLAVFDYNDNRDYRLLLSGTDRLIYNYTMDGHEVEGWNHHRSEELVSRPLQHIVAEGKDYLIVSDVTGGVRILDRQGRIRIPLSSDMQKSPSSEIYENLTNHSKGLFLTTDKAGKLLYVAADGALARTDFGDFSERHYFLYEDFNGDQIKDFIYLDGRDLHVFDRFKNVLFATQFDVDITTKPVFFQVTRQRRLLGLVSESAHTIYLIDHDGSMIENAGLVGDSFFTVGCLNRDSGMSLLTGSGNALFNYMIE